MVEEYVKKHNGEFTKYVLWKKLPKKTMYQTFCVIIEYLYTSRKLSIDTEGKLGWIYYPEIVKKRLSKKHLAWRKT